MSNTELVRGSTTTYWTYVFQQALACQVTLSGVEG